MKEILTKYFVRILNFFKIEMNQKAIESMIQFVMFCTVGVTNTLISYLINIFIIWILTPFGFQLDYLIANFVAFFLSVLWSFYWNNRLVFENDSNSVKQIIVKLAKTYVAYGFTGIFLNSVLSWIWIELIGISKYIAPLINLVISVPLNFTINKLWTYKLK